MFFELSTFARYVFPRKRRFSRSIISLISVFVIAAIVWLVLVFLSVTSGIEKKWLGKITALHAPLSVYPTNKYYQSYYYKADKVSASSNYRYKTLSEKLTAKNADPYNPEIDALVPISWEKQMGEDGSLLDIAKTAATIFTSFKEKVPGLRFDDFESSGVQFFLDGKEQIADLNLDHEISSGFRGMALIHSFSSENIKVRELITTISPEDFERLYKKTAALFGGSSHEVKTLFKHGHIKKVRIDYVSTTVLKELLKQGRELPCYGSKAGSHFSFLLIPDSRHNYGGKNMVKGVLSLHSDTLYFHETGGAKTAIRDGISCYCDSPFEMDVERVVFSDQASDPAIYEGKAFFAGATYPLNVQADNCQVVELAPQTHFDLLPDEPPLWTHFTGESADIKVHYPSNLNHLIPLVAPKHWKDKGYFTGDTGYLSYFATTLSGPQEQQLPFYIAGFYDPGISAVSAKSLMLPKEVVATISSTTDDPFYGEMATSGFNLFFPNDTITPQLTEELKLAFKDAGIGSYFSFIPYYEYEFVKDLLQQFKSDRYLFSIVSVIILIVASTNVISMLTLMVNDRKKEIAVLSALGASKKRIASIFMLAGGFIGLASTLIGSLLALVTLRHLDSIIAILSYLQGQAVFSEMFYGKTVATGISYHAFILALITTPLLSLIAGAIPAFLAAKVNPSQTLKAEGS